MKLGLSEKLEQALNRQVTLELESSYIYNGMRLYFKERGLPGATHWMTLQMGEEQEHAEDFIDCILDLDGHVVLGPIEEQTTEYESILDVFEKGLEHEQFISKSILEILEIAIEEKNYAAENFLRTYVDEQVEEEDNFRHHIDLIKAAGNNEAALFEVDAKLAQRQDH